MEQTQDRTPREDGFFMPAEYDPHQGTWMLWPQRPDNWRMGGQPAQTTFAAVASAIAHFEPVSMGANPDQYLKARAMLPPQIRVVELSNNDAWMRDCGPTFVVDAGIGLRGVDWRFNAWGGLVDGLYSRWDLDEAVAQKTLEIERVGRAHTPLIDNPKQEDPPPVLDRRYIAPLVLEGGSIHVDGEGTCLTTAECLLSPGRNPDLSQDQIEAHLQAYLNVEKVLWIPRGVDHDETNGHVDNLACFVRPGEVALTWTDDPSDPQYERSAEAFDFLMNATDAQGRALKVHKIHQPNPVIIQPFEAEGVEPVDGTLARNPGDRMAASYINFYLCNGGLIAPTFDDPHDEPALALLRQLFPTRQVVPIPAREILLGGGNIHCITQQTPANSPDIKRAIPPGVNRLKF